MSLNGPLQIALAQMNPVMGALADNAEKIVALSRQAQTAGAAAVVFPELSLCGYPPEDLLHKPSFLHACAQTLAQLVHVVPAELVVIVGAPVTIEAQCYNMAVVLHQGAIVAQYAKQKLPNYGVFDEKRYFTAGNSATVIDINGHACALTICEDLWTEEVAAQAKAAGAEALLNLNASPFHQGKQQDRELAMIASAQAVALPLVYVNQVGGQDELVFDGNSFVLNQAGEKVCALPQFEEAVAVCNLEKLPTALAPQKPEMEARVYGALVLGVQDYVRKNGFKKVILGLSGGIDSALTLCVAVDALGAEQVEVLMMPSRYNLDISLQDAKTQAETLGVAYQVISIEPMFKAFLSEVDFLQYKTPDVTEENIQARIRGILLMARSNQTGAMLLTTGNKSELSVGYATLYGDMAGGFAPIKDVYKTLVFALAKWRNKEAEVIPQRVISRPPSAELSHDQKDTDSLPDYPLLDKILQRYIEKHQGAEEIGEAIGDVALAQRIVRMVDNNEYKRRQAPPGVKITTRAYGKDRRYPITNRFGKA